MKIRKIKGWIGRTQGCHAAKQSERIRLP